MSGSQDQAGLGRRPFGSIELARYYRTVAAQAPLDLDYRTFMDRFEALIAVCSVSHHTTDVPRGVVGINTARRKVQNEMVPLRQEVQQKAYQIYRGTLGELEILDLGKSSDP